MKKLRMRRIVNGRTGKIILVPLDHGLTNGPVEGITRIREPVQKIVGSKANGIILHKGMITASADILSRHRIGVILHLSASIIISPAVDEKVIVSSVQEALRLGVDAVSMHINIGTAHDTQMLRDLGLISEQCNEWNMPLIVMMYTRGDAITRELDEHNLAIAARTAMELGADVVKVPYTGSIKSFSKVVSGVNVPVLIAGDKRKEDVKVVFQLVHDAIEAGASGICMGRNVFQSPKPSAFLKAIDGIVNDGLSVAQAADVYAQGL